MPVENERKYVLSINDVNAYSSVLENAGMTNVIGIQQGYLRGNARIRKSFDWDFFTPRYTFTYKIMAGSKLIEIETDISEQDFNDLWTVADRKIVKNRCVVPVGDLDWEIDFFFDDDSQIYLVMAEIELPEGIEEPAEVPPFITDNLLYKVVVTDERFFNAALSDFNAVRETIDELKLLR